MSFRKKGRNFRPDSGKTFPRSSGRVAASDGHKFVAVIAETLREEFGGTRMSVKTVMAYPGNAGGGVKST